MGNPPHLLHVFPNFGVGGAEMTIVLVVNKLGGKFRHSFMAVHGDYSAMERIDSSIDARKVEAPPRTDMFRFPLAMRRVAKAAAPDLICTYNWGSTDLLLGMLLGSFCPVVHNEHGFEAEEAQALKARRVWARRILLRGVYATVVPSRTMLRIAREQYHLEENGIRAIYNRIDTDRFLNKSNWNLRERHSVDRDQVLFGFVGALRSEKNLSLLIGSFHNIPNSKLMIVGDGPCLSGLKAISDNRVIFTGRCQDPAESYAAFDVFCMSSITEQQSISLLEAMASGLPCITTDVGDSAELLGNPGFPQVVRLGDVGQYTEAMRRFEGDKALRESVGKANRERAQAHYSHHQMVAEYERLWMDAISDWEGRA